MPLQAVDRHYGNPGATSVYAPSDLAPLRNQGDVTVVGHAYAPPGTSVPSLVARVVVGSIDKSIEITRDRAAQLAGGGVREGGPFSRMPLRYEYAASGADNPVGQTFEGASLPPGLVRLPNLSPVGRSAPGNIAPIGFGPIAERWLERRRKLGAHAPSFPDGHHDRPLPDIDESYFQCAPADQRATLSGDEVLLLEHLSPHHPRLETKLPGLRPAAHVTLDGGGRHELAFTCDGLWIDTDAALATLTFRGTLLLERPAASGRVLLLLDGPGARSGPGRRVSERTLHADVTVSRRPALPFSGGAQPSGPAPAPPPVVAPPPVLPLAAPPVAPSSPPPSPPPARAAAPARARPAETLELLWHHAPSAPRLRGHAAWRPVVEALEQRSPEPDLDGEAEALDPDEGGGRREAFEILAVAPAGEPGLASELAAAAIREDGRFVAPLALLAGSLQLALDELALLSAGLAVARPFHAADKVLREVSEEIRALLPELRSSAGVDALLTRLRDAFAQAKKPSLPADYFEQKTERAVLEARRYQERAVLGGTYLRGALSVRGQAELPVYLPTAIASRLPLVRAFRARLIATVELQQDPLETAPHALRVLALARVAEATTPRRGG